MTNVDVQPGDLVEYRSEAGLLQTMRVEWTAEGVGGAYVSGQGRVVYKRAVTRVLERP